MLRSVNQRYRSAIRMGLTEAGLEDLPQRGYWALTTLAGAAGDASDLISEMGVTKQAVSKLVETLVAAGYIDRKSNQEDRRRSNLSLTEKGHEAVGIIASAVRATDRDFIEEVGPASFGQWTHTLARLASVPAHGRPLPETSARSNAGGG